MLSQVRRLVVFAALASLLTLSFAPSAAAQVGTGCPNDLDCDGVSDMDDRYGNDPNRTGIDSDGDGIDDHRDTCPTQWNPTSQADLDGDGKGDACDDDRDGDGVANADQKDLDGDGKGDACDSDIDGDGHSNGKETSHGTNPADPNSYPGKTAVKL